jgi:hypothetical membrane protein
MVGVIHQHQAIHFCSSIWTHRCIRLAALQCGMKIAYFGNNYFAGADTFI